MVHSFHISGGLCGLLSKHKSPVSSLDLSSVSFILHVYNDLGCFLLSSLIYDH